MIYKREIILKNGFCCILRNGEEQDGQAVLNNFNLTHSETDFLCTYPDENRMTVEDEEKYLKEKAESANEIEIIAEVGGVVAGTAGIEAIGTKDKLRHRAEFGISIAREFWGQGIGSALTEACIECAKKAGYVQLELDVVADNHRAMLMYQKAGFVEYGRNPMGFKSRDHGFQELVHMRLEL